MSEYIQLIETCETLKEATTMFKALRVQVGFKDGSVYFDGARKSKRYVCEAFFDPKCQLAHLGLVSEPRQTVDAQQ